MQTVSDNTNPPDTEEEAFSFRQLIQNWWEGIRFAFRYRQIIFTVALAGALLGIAYAFIKHSTYTAKLTFVVEESKASGGSLASALAGSVGLDIGSLAGSSGVLAGDNVLELLKSHTLIKTTLLTPYPNDSAKKSIADQYADVYGWKEKWKADPKIGRQVNFPPYQTKFTRLEDSLLQAITLRLTDNELSISKPDKKLGFFELDVTTREEKLSQLICEKLVKITTDFYIDTKTKRLSNNVARLQRRADSLGVLLDQKTYSAAEANQRLLDANPAYSSPTVDAEIITRNKYIQSTIYAEIIKNLEVSKTSLIQETPTIQIVDNPELPLKKNKVSFLLAALAGGLIGFAGTILFFTTIRKK